jgi:carbon starvation protein
VPHHDPEARGAERAGGEHEVTLLQAQHFRPRLTRLGRYLLQELFGWRGRAGALAATAVTCGVPLAFVLASRPDSYRDFWTLFGTSNQLLAALSLLAVSVWLKRGGRRYLYTFLPMCFVLSVTLVSLALQARQYLSARPTPVNVTNGVVALVLLALAGLLLVHGGRALLAPPAPEPVRAPDPA